MPPEIESLWFQCKECGCNKSECHHLNLRIRSRRIWKKAVEGFNVPQFNYWRMAFAGFVVEAFQAFSSYKGTSTATRRVPTRRMMT